MEKYRIIRTVFKGSDMKMSERSLWMEFDAIEDAESFLTASRQQKLEQGV